MEKLKRSDPDFYRKISAMRKVKSGGKYFKDVEKAREAQRKGVETKRARKALETEIETDTKTA